MKKLTQSISILLCIAFLLGMGSCNSDDCDDPSASYSAITSVSHESTGFYYTPTPYYLVTPIVNNSIKYNTYSIQVIPTITTYGICPETPSHTDKIQNIEIFCLQNFNATHSAGSDVTQYFDVIDETYNNRAIRIDIQEYLATLPLFPDEAFLLLNEAPSDSLNHQFKVKLTLSGQGINTVEFTTASVNITLN